MKNEKKQTAVEWFFDQLTEVDYNCINKTFLQSDKTLAGYKLRELLQQAKERDKEQKLNMFNCGRQYQVTGEGTFKQVYQEIYGGGDK
jgi:hypothetical protein